MTTTPIDNTSITTDFNVDELTEGTLTGKGVFDVLLQTLRLHLDREFNSNRITGTAYATVYSQAITTFLAQAAQYAISKAKLPLELQLLQEQINLTQKQQNQITAAIRQTDYVTDYQLPSEVANKTKQTELLAYELTNIKPVELSIAQQDLALKTAQADLVEYDLTTLKPQELALLQQQVAVQLYTVQTRMPAEVANIQAETALKAYDLTDIKPTEKAQITQQTSNLSSQQEQIVAETSRVLYEVNYKLPEEVTLIKRNQDQVVAQTDKVATDTVVTIKQGHLTDAQTCQVKAETNQVNAVVATKLPKEVAQIEAQTSLLAYDLTDIKPAEKSNLINTGLNIAAQTANTEQNTLNLVKQGNLTDKQALNTVAETSQVTYKTNIMMPEELKVLKLNQDQLKAQITKASVDTIVSSKQGNLVDAQVCEVKASANKINVEVATKLPEEIEILKRNQIQLTAQTGEIDYRVSTLLPSQTAQNTAQTAQITYTTSYVLPSQVSLTNAQTDSANAQTALYNQKTVTELAQTTSTPASGSVMGVQNDLMATQKASYLRDAEQKAAKMLIDTWNIRMNTHPTDTNFNATNRLSDDDIGDAVGKMLTGIGVV